MFLVLLFCDSGNIVYVNLLCKDWFKVCLLKEGVEIFVVGNLLYFGSLN